MNFFKRPKKQEEQITDPKRFFEINHIKVSNYQPPEDVTIPEPTAEDLVWAKDFYKQDPSFHAEFADLYIYEKNLWRLQFMLTAEDTAYAGLQSILKQKFPTQMKDQSKERMMLALSCIQPTATTLTKILKTCPAETAAAIKKTYHKTLNPNVQQEKPIMFRQQHIVDYFDKLCAENAAKKKREAEAEKTEKIKIKIKRPVTAKKAGKISLAPLKPRNAK